MLVEKNSLLINNTYPSPFNDELIQILKRHASQTNRIRQAIEIDSIRHQIQTQAHNLASLETLGWIPKPMNQEALPINLDKDIVSALGLLNIHPHADKNVVYRYLYQKCKGRLYYITKRNQDIIPENYKEDLLKYLNKNAFNLGIDISRCEDNWIAEAMIANAYYKIKMEIQ